MTSQHPTRRTASQRNQATRADTRDDPNMTGHDTGRLLAFTDGVFAIAITLLVLTLLNLQLPPTQSATRDNVTHALQHGWPIYLTYVFSFASILIMWIYHHRLFQSVQRADTVLLFSNGFLLLLVSMAPFPTSLVGAYLMTPAASVACAVYAGFFALIDLAYNLLWWVVLRQHAAGARPIRFTTSVLISFAGFPCYVIAAIVAFVSPALTLVICAGLWVVWAITAHTLRGELVAIT